MQIEKQNYQKQWWAPIWKGLVVDEQAKHYRKMKNAIWLYLYLIVNANRVTGVLLRKIGTISTDMGIPRDTIIRWLNLLRKEDYIATINTGRSLTIQIKNWKPLSKHGNTRQQKPDLSNTRGWKYPIPVQARFPPNAVHTGPKTSLHTPANNMNINILLNNNTMQNTSLHRHHNRGFTSVADCSRQEILALDLAKALSDPGGIGRYRSYCHKYPEPLLRKILNEVNEVPAIKIKKSRVALFNYLLQYYVQRTTKNPGG